MIYYHDHGLHWRAPTCRKVETLISHLHTILRAWEGTPYMPGQKMKQVGVDCVRFTMAVYEELFQMAPIELPLLPSDTAMHHRRGAIRAMRQIKRLLPPMEDVRDGSIEPGDLLVVGQAGAGPGHAIVAGFEKNTLWQAGSRCVHRGGLGLISGFQQVFRVYRMKNRDELLS